MRCVVAQPPFTGSEPAVIPDAAIAVLVASASEFDARPLAELDTVLADRWDGAGRH